MNGIGSRKGKVTERGGRGVPTFFARSESNPSKRPTNSEDGEALRGASVAGCSGTTAAHFFVFGSLSIIMVILYLVQEGQVPEPSRQQRLAKNNNVSRVELSQQPSSTAQEEPLLKSSSSWHHRVDGSNGHHLPSFCNNKGNNEEEHATPFSNRFDNPFDAFIDQCHTAVVSKYMPKLWRYSDHEFLPGVFIAAMNKEKAAGDGGGGSSSVEAAQSSYTIDDVVPSAHDLWPQYAYPVLASPVCLRTGLESSSSTMTTRNEAVGGDDPEPEEDHHQQQVVQEIFMLKQHEFQKYASRLLKTKAPKRASSSGGSHHHNLANSGLVVDGSTQLPPFSSDVSSTEVAAAAHQQQQAEGSSKSLSAEASNAGGGIVFQDFADLYRIHNPRAATSQRYMNIKKVSVDVLKQQVTAEHQSNSPSHTTKLTPRFAMILPLGQSSIFHALDGSMSNALNFVKEYFQGNSADGGEATATTSSSSPWSSILDVWGLEAPREYTGGYQMIGGSTSSAKAKGSTTTSSSTAAILNKKNRHDLGVKFALSSMTSATHHSRLVSAANTAASSSQQQQLQCYCGGTIVQDTRPLQRRFKLLPALRNRLIRAAKSELESRSMWCERAEVVNEKRNRRSVAVWKKYWLSLYRQQHHGTAASPQQEDVGEQSMLHAVDAFIPKDIASRRRGRRTTTTTAAVFKVHPTELLPIPPAPTNSSSSSSTSPEVGGLQHYKDALREAHLVGNGLWRRLGSKMPTLNKNKRQKNKKKETTKKKQKLAVSEWTPPPSTLSSSSSPKSAAPRLLFILRNKTRLLAAPNTMRRAMLRNGFNVLTVTFDSYTDAITKTTMSPPPDFDDALHQDRGNGGRGSPPTKLNGDYFVSTSSVEGIQEVHDPAEQVALARYADVIVSVHGAALTWMMAQDAVSPTRPPTTFAKSSSSTPQVPTKKSKKKSSKKMKDGESNWGRQCRAVIELNHWGTKLRGVHNVYKRLAADLGLMYENVFPTDVEFFAHYNNTVVENGGQQVEPSSSKTKTSKKSTKEPATTTKLRSAGDPQYDKEEQRHQQAKQRLMSNRFPHTMLEFHEQVLTYDVSDGGSSNDNGNGGDDDVSSADGVSAVDKVLKNVWKRLVEDEECGLIL